MEERLQKILSARGVASRRKAEELIEAHSELLEAIRNRNTEDLTEKVRSSYFEEELKYLEE